MIEPFFMTAKSEQQQSHADDPNAVSSAAAAQGVSRIRRNCVVSLPSKFPIPREPIASGNRAPVDSPTWTKGNPFCVATVRTWPIFFEFVALVDAPFTVKSFTQSPMSRPSILAKPTILPSRGVCSSSALITLDAPNNPVSIKLPLSTSASIRSHAFSCPRAFLFSSFCGPPIPAAFPRRRSSSSSVSSCAMALFPYSLFSYV